MTLSPSDTVVGPSFTAPLGVGNSLTFELVVDDGKEFSAPDEVVITVVANSPPVADAGADDTMDEGAPVNLDGTGSSDPDGGDTLSFYWTEPVLLNNVTSPTPSFTAPIVGPGGTDLVFYLVVTDDDPILRVISKIDMLDSACVSAKAIYSSEKRDIFKPKFSSHSIGSYRDYCF